MQLQSKIEDAPAALLAVAVFGAVLVAVFNRSLDHSLDRLALLPDVRAGIDADPPQLAAAHSPNRAACDHGILLKRLPYVIWIATGLAALSAIAAWVLIEPGAATPPRRLDADNGLMFQIVCILDNTDITSQPRQKLLRSPEIWSGRHRRSVITRAL